MDLHIPIGAPSDLFITEALDERGTRAPDYRQQSRAIQALAVQMANDPEEVLPKFVDLAMEITGAVSAGLSLWEPSPAPGVFRWRYLRGSLSPFEGATTPRNFSPCGVTLDRNAAVLTLHPERTYTWIVEAGVTAPEVLLVPLYIGGAEPLGTLWVVAETEGQFNRDHAQLLTDLAECVGGALAASRRM
jgi:GAF domain-containing protein